MKQTLHTILLALLALAVLAGCGPQKAPAAKAVEAHITALVNKDEASLTALTCADWETEALLEYDAFANLTATLKGLDCQQTGTDGDAALVTCKGNIEASYNNEVQSFDLGQRVYKVVPQAGDWLVCGYSQ
jgi:hypothetical protein